jgi:hypothetical protein
MFDYLCKLMNCSAGGIEISTNEKMYFYGKLAWVFTPPLILIFPISQAKAALSHVII